MLMPMLVTARRHEPDRGKWMADPAIIDHFPTCLQRASEERRWRAPDKHSRSCCCVADAFRRVERRREGFLGVNVLVMCYGSQRHLRVSRRWGQIHNKLNRRVGQQFRRIAN